MYILTVKRKFDAAHFLPYHEGKCSQIHGHTWKVEVEIRAKELTDGMVVDFVNVKGLLDEILPDHQHLNNVINNPTAERLARYLYRRLREDIHDMGAHLDTVTVWESDDCGATYWEGN